MSAPMSLDARQTLQWLHAWSEQGWLRRIDSALPAELLRLDPQAPPALLVAAAALAHMEGRGHTCLPLRALCVPAGAGLGWPAPAQEAVRALWLTLPSDAAAWADALRGPLLRAAQEPDAGQALVLGGPPQAPLLYWRRYAAYEQRVGQGLWARARQALPVPEAQARLWLDRFFAPREGLDWQKIACAVALRARLSVLTGGPGTGKTYTAARLLALLLALHTGEAPLRVALAAPTGKAAARLKQSIDEALLALPVPADAGLDLSALVARMGSARTLHSLLGARPDTRAWRHHAGAPLALDVLIVDEASMVHLEMMDALLQALPPHARLVLLGDKDQLASVEAGAVLGELCRDAARGAYATPATAWPRGRPWTKRRRGPRRRCCGPCNRLRPRRSARSPAGAGRAGRLRTPITWPCSRPVPWARAKRPMPTGCAPCCRPSSAFACCARCARAPGAPRA